MKLIFCLLFSLTIMLVPQSVSADKILLLKYDDGGIIKWHIPVDFDLSYVNLDTENFIIPMLKLRGKFSEIMIPVATIEWTLRNAENGTIEQGGDIWRLRR